MPVPVKGHELLLATAHARVSAPQAKHTVFCYDLMRTMVVIGGKEFYFRRVILATLVSRYLTLPLPALLLLLT